MKNLYIDGPELMPGKDFVITGEEREVVFRVCVVCDKKEVRILLCNVRGEQVSCIIAKKINAGTKCSIMFGESTYCVVSRMPSLFADSVKLECITGRYTLNGDGQRASYTLYDEKKRMFGWVNKKWFEDGSAFCLTSGNSENTAAFVSMVLAVDYCMNKRFS